VDVAPEKLKLKELPGKEDGYYLLRPLPCTAVWQEAIEAFTPRVMNPFSIF
jgi:hypothetical protein